MVNQDVLGNAVSKGDTVMFALSPGNFVIGKVNTLTYGLDGSPPMVLIDITVPVPVHPANGIVQGILVVRQAEKQVEGR